MNESGMLVLIVVLVAGVLALPVSVLVRIVFLPFSKRVRGQVRKHPFLHILWFLIAAIVFMVFVMTGSERPKKKCMSNQASEARRCADSNPLPEPHTAANHLQT